MSFACGIGVRTSRRSAGSGYALRYLAKEKLAVMALISVIIGGCRARPDSQPIDSVRWGQYLMGNDRRGGY
ncbi:hypothetical protein SCLCIDRAFT_1210646 [Scleroderma citrinum Foug A]|uniref:Uncharacterized protein n=1 Tax=Scleroderma citrinum Foug A TaxID=1036808 RepID=A0A0C3EGW2_9AGAM|nr:hypothetical protein SCLCIDRAFT_1210646 [Scleroderma citrinum Foug A]